MFTAMPGHLSVDELALTGVHAGPYLEVELGDGFGDRARTADRPCGAVEGGEEPVPGRVLLLPRK